jgi:drug/metabolite transporter (DMT)-like permease
MVKLEGIALGQQKSRVKYGFIWVALSAVLWGASYVAYEAMWWTEPIAIYENFTLSSIVVSAITTLMFLIFLLLFWVLPAGKIKEVARTIVRPKMDKWLLAGTVVGGILATLGSVMATGYVGPTLAASASIMAIALGAAVAAVWNHEKMDRKTIIAIVAIIIGGVVMLNPTALIGDLKAGGSILGYVGIIFCVIGWGCEGNVIVRVLDITDSDSTLGAKLMIEVLIWFLVLLPVTGIFVGFGTLFDLIGQCLASTDLLLWIMIVSACMSVCYAATYKGFPLIGVGRTGSVNSLYAVVALLFLFVFFGRVPDWIIIVGVVICIAGVFYMYSGGGALLEGNRVGGDE